MPRSEIPFSFYDRPSVSFMNLIRGDVPASAQALFAPSELSPDEAKSMRNYLLRGKAADDPILKTVVGLATNPLVIAGLVMALLPMGRVASGGQLFNLIRKGGTKMAPVIEETKGFLSPLSYFRNLWDKGIYNHLLDMPRWMRIFQHGVVSEADDAMAAFVKLNKREPTAAERWMVGLWKEGWHKGSNPVKEALADRLGDIDVLTPGLVREMEKTPGLVDFARESKGIDTRWGQKLLGVGGPENPEAAEILEGLANKGVEYIPENYLHRLVSRTNLDEYMLQKGEVSLRTQRTIARLSAQKGRPGAALHARTGYSMPMMNQLEELTTAHPGLFDPKVIPRLKLMEEEKIGSLKRVITGVALDSMGPSAGRTWGQAKEEIVGVLTSPYLGYNIRPEAADQLANHLLGGAHGGPEIVEKLADGIARIAGAPAKYTLDAVESQRAWAQASAPAYAYWSKGLKGQFIKIFGDVNEQSVPPWVTKNQKDMWYGEVLPMLLGNKHPNEAARALRWNDLKVATQMYARESQLMKKLPKKTQDWLLYNLSDVRGSWSEKTFTGGLSHMMQLGTLGANPNYLYKNLFQPIFAASLIGPKSMAKGMAVMSKRVPRFLSEGKRVGWDKAFKEVFPEYWNAIGPENIGEAMRVGDVAKEGAIGGKIRGGWRKVQDALMKPGAVSEYWNRLLVFYSGREHGLASGIGDEAADQVGRFVTTQTMFGGGVLGQPNRLRGVSAPLRQFMHFPMRMMDLMYMSGRLGPEAGKVSMGTVGRALAGSAGIYEIGKNMLGTDLSPALLMAALPNPSYEGAPFYPFPFVPPVAGIAGAAAMGLASGDYSKLGQAAWMAVPGGLAGSRAYRNFSPRYADYGAAGADGRIPVYNKNKMLVGSYTPIQLVMKGMGLSPADSQKEMELTNYLIKQREKIRDYRRLYLDELMRNNLERATQVNEAFQKEYPELGPIQVKKADIRAVENRREMSRASRVLRGFPAEYRPVFQRLVDEAGLAALARDVEFDPSVVETYRSQGF